MGSPNTLCFLILLVGTANVFGRFTTRRTTRKTSTPANLPELDARPSTYVDARRVWWDEGGFSKYDFACYEPARVTSDWYVLGQRGQADYKQFVGSVYSFKDVRKEALSMPYGFILVWDDKGSIMNNDGSVWRVNCAPGYVALGDFFYPANRIDSPGSDLYYKAMCVRKDLTELCQPGGKIWDDTRSWANKDVSVWSSLGSTNSLGGFLWANTKHEVPPTVDIYCLKKSAYRQVSP